MLCQLTNTLDVTCVLMLLAILALGCYWLTTTENLPPGPVRLPVVGSMLSFVTSRGDVIQVIEKFHQLYGHVFTLQLGIVRFVVLNSYEAIQEAFLRKGDIFSGRPTDMYILKHVNEIIGPGILFNEGPTLKAARRVAHKAMRDFGMGKKTLEERVREEARAVMDVLDKCQGQEICMMPLLAKSTTNIICSITFGARFEYGDPTFIKLTSAMDEAMKQNTFFVPINFFPFLRFFLIPGKEVNIHVNSSMKLDNCILALLKGREETFNPGEIRDFVDLYVKSSQESKDKQLLTPQNMVRTIRDLLFAGPTTAVTINWLILYMVQFPNVQLRCQQEIDEAVGQDRMVQVEDRSKLPYVEAVICEILRLLPPGIPHTAVRDGTVAGYTIPARTIVLANHWAVHRNPKVWPDPLVFKPERFLDKQGHFCAPKNHWIPFSIGPRVCLGEALARMELFILFSTLVQFYTFTMDNGKKPNLEGQCGVNYCAIDQNILASRR